MLPFFNVWTRDVSPFSCLNVKHTSKRKSSAISSLIRCSLMRESKTFGGTEALAVRVWGKRTGTKVSQIRREPAGRHNNALGARRLLENILIFQAIIVGGYDDYCLFTFRFALSSLEKTNSMRLRNSLGKNWTNIQVHSITSTFASQSLSGLAQSGNAVS